MFNSQATEETFDNFFHIKYHITLETEFPTRNKIESMTDSSKNTTVSIEIFNKIIPLKNPLFQELQRHSGGVTFTAHMKQHARGAAYSKLKPATAYFCFAQRLAGISFFCVAY